MVVLADLLQHMSSLLYIAHIVLLLGSVQTLLCKSISLRCLQENVSNLSAHTHTGHRSQHQEDSLRQGGKGCIAACLSAGHRSRSRMP